MGGSLCINSFLYAVAKAIASALCVLRDAANAAPQHEEREVLHRA
jgi:hypothetical protein